MPLLVKSLPTLHFFMGFSIGALTLAFLLRIILTWYPKIDLRNWKKISTESFKQDSENEYDFSVETFVKN